MDDPNNNNRRRQNDPPLQGIANPRFPHQEPTPSRRGMAGSATERFRPAPLNTSAARGMSSAGNYGGYYQDQAPAFPTPGMSQGGMAYQSADYGQDGRQSHGFGTYNPSIMYPVGAAGQHNTYEPPQQFQGRQPGTMPMMAGDVPQYFQSDGAAATASAMPTGQSASATQSSTMYPQQQQQIPGFSGTLPSVGGGPGTGQAGAAGMTMDDGEYSATGTGSEERWADYRSRLARVFQDIQSGNLKRASETLLGVSNWLLTQVVDLGLHIDDRNLHADRVKLWNDFNHAWLGLLQRQKDMAETDDKPQGSRSLISRDELEDMGKEVVRLCDGVEKHGLVDYQCGVWEEQIIAILTDCLDFYESGDESGPSGGGST